MIVLCNLGLGDHLLCNGLVRELAKTHDELTIPVWNHNLASVAWMYSDLPSITTISVSSSHELTKFDVPYALKLGCYDPAGYDQEHFDTEFYRQAAIPFSHRWDSFHSPESTHQVKWPTPFIFCHDDVVRGFTIPGNHLPDDIPVYRPRDSQNIFDYVWMIQNAQEVHVINSSFLILADSLMLSTDKLYFHRYPRPTAHPTLRHPWKMIE